MKTWIDLAFLTSAFKIKVVIFIYAIKEIDSKNLLWTFLPMIPRFLPLSLDRVKLLIPSGGIFQKYISPTQQKEWGKLSLVVFFSVKQNGSRSRQSIPLNKERSYWITFIQLLMGKPTIHNRMINSFYTVTKISELVNLNLFHYLGNSEFFFMNSFYISLLCSFSFYM